MTGILGKFRCEEKGGIFSQIPVLHTSYGTFKQVKPQALAGCLYFCFVFVATQRKTTPWVLCESANQTDCHKKISGSHWGLVCFHKALIHHQAEWLSSAKWPEILEQLTGIISRGLQDFSVIRQGSSLDTYRTSGNSWTRTPTSIWIEGVSSNRMISDMWGMALSNHEAGDSCSTK